MVAVNASTERWRAPIDRLTEKLPLECLFGCDRFVGCPSTNWAASGVSIFDAA